MFDLNTLKPFTIDTIEDQFDIRGTYNTTRVDSVSFNQSSFWDELSHRLQHRVRPIDSGCAEVLGESMRRIPLTTTKIPVNLKISDLREYVSSKSISPDRFEWLVISLISPHLIRAIESRGSNFKVTGIQSVEFVYDVNPKTFEVCISDVRVTYCIEDLSFR